MSPSLQEEVLDLSAHTCKKNVKKTKNISFSCFEIGICGEIDPVVEPLVCMRLSNQRSQL